MLSRSHAIFLMLLKTNAEVGRCYRMLPFLICAIALALLLLVRCSLFVHCCGVLRTLRNLVFHSQEWRSPGVILQLANLQVKEVRLGSRVSAVDIASESNSYLE